MIKINTVNQNKTYNLTKAKYDLSKEIEQIIKKMKLRIERELPDKGYFCNFSENLSKGKKIDIYAKDFALFIEKDETRDGRAYLGISALHPNLQIDSATYLISGDRKTILDYMNKENFSQEVENKLLKLSEALKNI